MIAFQTLLYAPLPGYHSAPNLHHPRKPMNNPDSSTMFAHIVSRLTNRTEDVAVDALGFILSRSDAARRALRDLLKLEGLDVGELTGAATQVGDGTLARPDLAVCDRERKERVLMEAKFWAGLTGNQPNAYLARLPRDERPTVLLFVAPEARLETLWPELRRLIEPPFNWRPVERPHDTEIRCALVDGATRYLALASWRTLLNRMLSFAMSSGDSVEADIRQLQALCEQQDQEAFLPLRPTNSRRRFRAGCFSTTGSSTTRSNWPGSAVSSIRKV